MNKNFFCLVAVFCSCAATSAFARTSPWGTYYTQPGDTNTPVYRRDDGTDWSATYRCSGQRVEVSGSLLVIKSNSSQHMSFEIISSDGGTWPMSYGIGEYTATQSSGEHEIVGHQTNTHLVHGQRHRYSVKLLLQSTNPNGSGGGYEVFWYIDNILQTTALCNLATSSAPMLALGTNSPTLPNW